MQYRSIVLGLTSLATLLFCGIQLTGPCSMTTSALVSSCLILAFVGGSLLPDRRNNTAIMRDQLTQIRNKITAHLDAGHDMLAPNDMSNRTSSLILGYDDEGFVYIQETPPVKGAHRRYVILPTQVLRRTLIERGDDDQPFTRADHEWCYGTLTPKRLQGIIDALTDADLYVPRVVRVRL